MVTLKKGPMNEVWYRVEFHHYAPLCDEFDNPVGSGTRKIEVYEYKVLKKTPKGVWINCCLSRRFVLNGSKRQFASPTKELAYEKFRKRKERHLEILMGQVRDVEWALSQIPGASTAPRETKTAGCLLRL